MRGAASYTGSILNNTIMSNRPWIIATSMLGFAAILFVWHLMGTNSSMPIPLLLPREAPRDNNRQIINSFGIADQLPNELDAQTFSRMIDEFSEPGGYFMYDNHLSNERSYRIRSLHY